MSLTTTANTLTSASDLFNWRHSTPLLIAAAAVVMTAPVVTAALLRTRGASNPPGITSIPSLPLFVEAKKHATTDSKKVAVIDRTKGQSFTYRQLLSDVSEKKKWLLEHLSLADLGERRIAFLIPNGYDYVVMQWAVWAAGGVCVPLCMFLLNTFELYLWLTPFALYRYLTSGQRTSLYNQRLAALIGCDPPSF